jgi:hypothetical protein
MSFVASKQMWGWLALLALIVIFMYLWNNITVTKQTEDGGCAPCGKKNNSSF